MNGILHKSTVLVLNRHWQAIHVKTPTEAFCMMASNAATALDISDANFLPTKWSAWIALPVRGCDQAVNTPRGPVRVPTVIIAVNYARVPLRRPRFGARGIWDRDGAVCQYTGRKLAPNEGNIDHVVPRSRGGKPRGTTASSRTGRSTVARVTAFPRKQVCACANALTRLVRCPPPRYPQPSQCGRLGPLPPPIHALQTRGDVTSIANWAGSIWQFPPLLNSACADALKPPRAV